MRLEQAFAETADPNAHLETDKSHNKTIYMRKVYLLFLTFAAATLAVTGCKTASQKSGADSTLTDSAALGGDTMTVDSIVFTDVSRDSTVECSIRIDFPYGSDSFSLAVKAFIGDELAALFLPYNNEEEAVARKYPRYKGSVLEGKQMVDHYGRATMEYFSDSQKSTMQEMGWGEEDRPRLSEAIGVRKSDETREYVTFHITEYAYLGGAHPSFTAYSVNIGKRTGKPLTHTVDSTKLKAMQPILEKGVLGYLKLADESVSAKNYKSRLFLPDNGMIPLPAHAPYLQGDSVCFVYQQYEIAAYALGLVSFNVAYKDMENYLSKDAKELFGK